MEPIFVSVESLEITGISARTSNELERNVATGKIPGLWQEFMSGNLPNEKFIPYGVYHQYEINDNCEYTLTVGVPKTSDYTATDRVIIPAGEYLKFSKNGDFSVAVHQLWQEIWEYFATEKSTFQRSYQLDFENYPSEETVEIYIGVFPIY